MKSTILALVLMIHALIGVSQENQEVVLLPSVNVLTLEGKTFNTQDISNPGKPIIISFWAIWCKPCQQELDAFAENYADWQAETGVKIYAISIDDTRSSAKVLPLVSGKDWDFDVLLDPNSDFKRAMKVNLIPHTFLLDGNGKIVYQHTSYYPGGEAELYKLVQRVANGEDISKKE